MVNLLAKGAQMLGRLGIWGVGAGVVAAGAGTAEVAVNGPKGFIGGVMQSWMRTFGFNAAESGTETGFFNLYEIVGQIANLIEGFTGESDFTKGMKEWAQRGKNGVTENGVDASADNNNGGLTPNANGANGTGVDLINNPNGWFNSLGKDLTAVFTQADGTPGLNGQALLYGTAENSRAVLHGGVTGISWLAGGAVDLVVGTANNATNLIGAKDLIPETDFKLRDTFSNTASDTMYHVGLKPDLENSALAQVFNFAGEMAAGWGLGSAAIGTVKATGVLAKTIQATAQTPAFN